MWSNIAYQHRDPNSSELGLNMIRLLWEGHKSKGSSGIQVLKNVLLYHFPAHSFWGLGLKLLGSSLLALLCNREASLVSPIDGTGSQAFVVDAHLSRVPDLPHLHHVAYQPHQFLVGNQDSYLKLQSMKDCVHERCSSLLCVTWSP